MQTTIMKYSWQADSLCKKELKFVPETKEHVPYTYDDFYPPTGKAVAEEIKEMCDRCPVEAECAEFALANKEEGFWGGTTEQQREVIRKTRRSNNKIKGK